MEHFRTSRLIARDWSPDDTHAAFAIYGRGLVLELFELRRPGAAEQ